MRAQRPAEAAAAIDGRAEAIPLPDASVDAALAVFSDLHWDDCAAGLAELRRIARRRVVVLTIDHAVGDSFWLLRDYLPQARRLRAPGGGLAALSADAERTPVPVPWDCRDGFFRAFWRRPRAYLDPRLRAGMSVFRRLDAEYVEDAMAALTDDLVSGLWRERYGDLLDVEEFDVGVRLLVWTS
jgi:hypothetical protein